MVGNFKAAINDYNKALELNPYATDTIRNLISTIQEANNNETLNSTQAIQHNRESMKLAASSVDTTRSCQTQTSVSKIGMFQPKIRETSFKQESDPKKEV